MYIDRKVRQLALPPTPRAGQGVGAGRSGADGGSAAPSGWLGSVLSWGGAGAPTGLKSVEIAEAAGDVAALVALARGGTDGQKEHAARALRSLAVNADNQSAIAQAGGAHLIS